MKFAVAFLAFFAYNRLKFDSILGEDDFLDCL